MDGIILSLDKSITTDGQTYSRINVLMQEIVKGFHEEIPGSLVAIIYPWRLSCFTTHCNILPEILDQSDIIFVTSFDIPAYLDGCIAKPSSSYHYVLDGLFSFIQKGIDPRKIVMGISWSGYDFTCNHFREAGFCELGQHSGTKAVCSIQSANAVTYEKVMQLLSKSITGRLWDDHWRNPYFAYLDGKTYHEVWYDDPESISLKSTFLKKLKLRGIGIWAANYLNYSRNAWTLMQTEAMWNALCPP
ncbi:di-N-acetylchitobiase-like [Rhinoraja longicauda]